MNDYVKLHGATGYMGYLMWNGQIVSDIEITLDDEETSKYVRGQNNGGVLQAGFGFGEWMGSTDLALAALKPTFDGAAYMARLQGGAGDVPLYLKKNLFKSYLSRGNNAFYVGRVSSSAATTTSKILGVAAPALVGLGVVTNIYDIAKDGRLTAGDGFQAINTGFMIAFPVYGVAYGLIDLGFATFSDQSLTDRVKREIDSNVSGSVSLPWGH